MRAISRRVRILLGDVVIADADSARLLSETGLPNRYYLSRAHARDDLLEPSTTRTVCPYKGTARYRSLRVGGRLTLEVEMG
ncbi:DUF427 domain-containing protein [Jiangella aurantiaca]|uniref:DUF427 domain-containing protein n=1 Tax=Jiangella aurantiaca TaxID=2530373 RepID=UPI001EF0A3EE|nr:DUF427 domain-containing protein [Jiangella aurantiaca]